MLDDGRLVRSRWRECGRPLTSVWVCSVPPSKLPQLVYETKKDLADNKLQSTIVGHVGDGASMSRPYTPRLADAVVGNFHALILFKDDKELHTVSDAVHRLVRRAIRMDGTCECLSELA